MSESVLIVSESQTRERYDTHVANPWVKKNRFLSMPAELSALPTFAQARAILPDPIWANHSSTIDCYWRAWELAFGNLHAPTAENNFVSNYCDTAFNGN